MATQTHLNLARKLRPKKFDQVIGQSMPVRMLCNGLALGKLFPTYIFSGQRGCGKTTTARIFACALNCQKLSENLKSKSAIPCLECNSCTMMAAGSHPDFVEIDAASHTGVDNVRQILETATYFPLAGNKKIYLIDEAHMLSKSAFNALLKMLEEPPASAIFMLATTELGKIPDTVRSRCFHALFKPISGPEISDFLAKVCADEKIELSENVIKMVAQRCEGSLRDSLNILEQVSWACLGQDEKSQEQTAAEMFGLTPKTEILDLGGLIIEGAADKIITKLDQINFYKKKPETLWQNIGQFLSELLRAKLSQTKASQEILELASKTSVERIKALGLFFWDHEDAFLKTPHKHMFLEHLIFQMASQIQLDPIENLINRIESAPSKTSAKPTSKPASKQSGQSFSGHQAKPVLEQTPTSSRPTPPEPKSAPPPKPDLPEPWLKFMENEKIKSDRLLESILKQVVDIEQKPEAKTLVLTIMGLNSFFEGKIKDSKELILNELAPHYPDVAQLELKCGGSQPPKPKATKPKNVPEPESKSAAPNQSRLPAAQAQNFRRPGSFFKGGQKSKLVDISDKEKWPKSNLLIGLFPGKVVSSG